MGFTKKPNAIGTLRALCALAIAFNVGFSAGGARRRMVPAIPSNAAVDGPPSRPGAKEMTRGAATFDRYETECRIPETTAKWRYYRALVELNARTARSARNVTEYAPKENERQLGDEPPRIPRRLVFTHEHDIFDCGVSASPMTPPELYNLAENAKATVRAYRTLWPDLDVAILTDDDCRTAVNASEPNLIPHFDKLKGPFKADLCRSAYLLAHGGYYIDVDMIVVHPYEAPPDVDFVTVKGENYPNHGFFQAFMASAPNHRVVKKSLRYMLDYLEGRFEAKPLLGPNALYQAYLSTATPDARLLSEFKIKGRWNGLPGQVLPKGHGHVCQFSRVACDRVVVNETGGVAYFYSRVQGTRFCHQRMRDAWECDVEETDKPMWYK